MKPEAAAITGYEIPDDYVFPPVGTTVGLSSFGRESNRVLFSVEVQTTCSQCGSHRGLVCNGIDILCELTS